MISELQQSMNYLFTESPPRPIQSICRNVCVSVCCVFVPSVGDRDWEGRRLQVEEHIVIIAKSGPLLFFESFNNFGV